VARLWYTCVATIGLGESVRTAELDGQVTKQLAEPFAVRALQDGHGQSSGLMFSYGIEDIPE
jgi:hypothetical protein